MSTFAYLLVYYMIDIHTGYVDKQHTIPQKVSGPYVTEDECTGLMPGTELTVPVNDTIKVYECIMVEEEPVF